MSHDLDYVGEDYRLTLTCVEMFIFTILSYISGEF